MKETSDALTANGQKVTKNYLINYIIDGKFDPIVVYITSELDSMTESISFTEVKFILQKYKQRLCRNAVYTFDCVVLILRSKLHWKCIHSIPLVFQNQ